ncbi:hypothetical protein RCL2_001272300 [Rhizophagus clarus]|uniref:Iminophenyl-pyruvate dimer synthase domain-containing protein n=1 Tax=Rhizophagus clarus TaxID=94130 RepID=A0A8H3LHQ5_9GLOM|nr:hypothetical protein RCL2_001272300 [Rhizophagus clarus]
MSDMMRAKALCDRISAHDFSWLNDNFYHKNGLHIQMVKISGNSRSVHVRNIYRGLQNVIICTFSSTFSMLQNKPKKVPNNQSISGNFPLVSLDFGTILRLYSLNVARVGNAINDSDDKHNKDYFYVGSEIPGIYVGKGDPNFKFKDNKGRIKPQAARFRIYGYDKNGTNLGEIKLKKGVDITWTVVLANRKAAHRGFLGIKKHHQKGTLRNADWPYDRSTLMAIREKRLTSVCGSPPDPVELKARVFRHNIIDEEENSEDGHELYLGKMIMENEGSLLIIGGKGESGCIKESTLITTFADNDYWYDDTSDGSVDAKVTIMVNNTKKSLRNREGKSWILVAPPKYAPGIPNITSLYQTILETQHPVDPNYPANDLTNYQDSDDSVKKKKIMQVNYYRDIHPIFEATCKSSWVNPKGFTGHGPDKPGNFLDFKLEEKLSNESPEYNDLRKSILSRVRIPSELASSFERDGQAYDYFMPPLSGNSGIQTPGVPDTFLSITRGQYLLLQKWAEGDFEKKSKLPEYNYIDKGKDTDSRKPTYSIGKNFHEMVKKILDDKKEHYDQDQLDQNVAEVKFLNKAALEWCVGGALFPGIEMTYLAYDKNTFHREYDFRINSDMIQPGDINAYLSIPWQADFNDCNTAWWPAQRPDTTISETEMLKDLKEMKEELEKLHISPSDVKEKIKEIIGYINDLIEEKQINWQTLDTIRKLMIEIMKLPDAGIIKDTMKNMVKLMNNMIVMNNIFMRYTLDWTRGFRNNEPNLGFPKWADMDMARLWNKLGFIVEREISDRKIKAFCEVERDEIYELNITSEDSFEATLDNLYELLKIALQIEFSTIPLYLYAMYSIKQGTKIGDMVRYKIRHVAAEEMLHASLVANLIVAIGRQPVFYSPEVIPFYPNPLPHFKQGHFMAHLSKADEKALDTFIQIEKPEEKQKPKILEAPSFDSVGELYKKISDFFEKLNNKIDYYTHFQLEPGMGYSPSTGTGNDGLIVIKDLRSAKDAIKLIIDQGEGRETVTPELINGTFDGTFKGEARIELRKGSEIKVEGTIEGNIKGYIKEGKDKIPIDGTIEKGNGIIKIIKNDEHAIVTIEKGIIKASNFERIIKAATIKINTKQMIGQTIEEKFCGSTIEEVNFSIVIKIDASFTGNIEGSVEESSHYSTFRICKMYIEDTSESEYRLWPVVEDPNISSYTDPNVIATATAFNAAYSYLMLLLQNAWGSDGQKKKTLVIGGMPALMHGVLKSIAVFLAKTPISTDTNAGATFGYYEFTRESSPKQQLYAAVEAASKAFPHSDELKSTR